MNQNILELKASADWWEVAGYVAASLVLIGVILESVELFHVVKAGKLRDRWVEFAGVLIVVVGLSFEILTQVQSNNRSGLVIAALDAEASNALKQAAALEVIANGRKLNSAQIDAISANLQSFAGRKVYISSYTGDAEAARLGLQIEAALRKAGIEVFDNLGRTSAGPGGVIFGIQLVAMPDDVDFAKTIASVISKDGKIEVSNQILPARIRMQEDSTTGIMIALRPL
ncbi:TPA: hypothetical protein QDA74_002556 [Burkholderia territorii]|uniref:hypothetical protein n=1 Tax=Burkholderia territorii TaxID=1503055 RepID=UPI0011C9FCD9|nr:hypothetical protein [Burkholderia territorii]TXG20409.1 hypothetical protein FU139_09180 [Burkholderia territorii]HDR8859347.1 hypothetical protein [Burkholderia territorii]HDR8866118.1 hypothetical protein [Burkholderia territorii]HDR8871856.1 hypothetical protein [Burkholderia territorii]HDR8877074.1 hypothetical protein [Burkholderia territorii]